MMKRILVSVAAIMLAHPVYAQPITLTTAQIGDVYQGLVNLDGYRDEKGQTIYYRIAGVARLTIAHDSAMLREYISAYQAAVQQLSLEEAQAPPADAQKVRAQHQKEQQDMLAVKHDIDLPRISTADLNLDQNPIPPSVLAMIWPILDIVPTATPKPVEKPEDKVPAK